MLSGFFECWYLKFTIETRLMACKRTQHSCPQTGDCGWRVLGVPERAHGHCLNDWCVLAPNAAINAQANARSAFVMVYELDLMNWGYVQTFPLIMITSFHWEQSSDNLVSYANRRKCSTCPCGFPWLGKSVTGLWLSGGEDSQAFLVPLNGCLISLEMAMLPTLKNKLEPVSLDKYETLK